MSNENEELKAEAAAEAVESIHIDEDDLKDAQQSAGWTEEVQMAGKDVLEFVKSIVKQGTARRVTVKNKEGRVLIDIPLAIGAVGFLPPVFMYTVVALGIALLAKCTISVEHVAEAEETAEEATA